MVLKSSFSGLAFLNLENRDARNRLFALLEVENNLHLIQRCIFNEYVSLLYFEHDIILETNK